MLKHFIMQETVLLHFFDNYSSIISEAKYKTSWRRNQNINS